MALEVGFEPTTLRLTVECSTVELLQTNGSEPTDYTDFRASSKLFTSTRPALISRWQLAQTNKHFASSSFTRSHERECP